MRRFYNWIHPIYGLIESHLGPKLDQVVQHLMGNLAIAPGTTALEYACGSGLLSLKLAPYFAQVTGRDQSEGMLQRARRRAISAKPSPEFRMGNLLAIDEQAGSVDYVFLSFALHLFSRTQRQEILSRLCQVARKEVIVIDHSRNSDWLTEWVERIEGSHYDEFIREDFAGVADQAGFARVLESEIATCMVLRFQKKVKQGKKIDLNNE
jgi:ubiquinone/menaquinone biosynthesis C-methylase UbiE